ncbi:hypothetical protein GCM10027321_43910 [Massilia terrae]|uniref:Lipoprotein n=1 Tax=Massilia terrae TaxID=1811224 RepID=A0ABT2D2R5_9BURK|nr:hypothetical protein [Massilia terrae]MCS0660543.1 hypothetical protein [Massilia terrae]
MKSLYLRTGAVALACALGLAGCGGSSGQLLLGGTVVGVTKDTLVLQNNGAHDMSITASGTFYFNDLIGIDEQYNVTVKSVPSNVDHCDVANPSGRSAFNVTNVIVSCVLKTHDVNATVSGLAGATGLVLVNGTTQVPVTADTASGALLKLGSVGEDQPYGYAVLTQPAGRICSIANGSGTMGSANISNVAITCVSTAN